MRTISEQAASIPLTRSVVAMQNTTPGPHTKAAAPSRSSPVTPRAGSGEQGALCTGSSSRHKYGKPCKAAGHRSALGEKLVVVGGVGGIHLTLASSPVLEKVH